MVTNPVFPVPEVDRAEGEKERPGPSPTIPIQEATITEPSTKHLGRKRQLKLAKSLLGLLVLKIERGDKIPPEFIVECREMAESE
jgi:hypothetical protein